MACALPWQMHDPPSRSTAAPRCSKWGRGRLHTQACSPAHSQGCLGWLRTDRTWSLREGCVGTQWSTELPPPQVMLPVVLPCSCKHIWLLHLTLPSSPRIIHAPCQGSLPLLHTRASACLWSSSSLCKLVWLPSASLSAPGCRAHNCSCMFLWVGGGFAGACITLAFLL